jgi:DNA-directed RNA polymerase subunit RPC12/RpoP
MAATNSPVLRVVCSSCGARYELPVSMAGRRGPCAKCGASIAVPAITKAGGVSVTPVNVPAAPTSPQYASVDCRVCQTRLTGSISQVGQELKCPDCGARTILPAPPGPKGKNIPAAMEGEQYELWDVDTAPLPSELRKAQPKYIAIECRLCQTLMHATEKQVGKNIACPDCGTKHIVPPLELKPTRSVFSNEEEPFLVDPSADPGERPPAILPPVRRMLYEEEAEAERARQAEAARRGKGPRRDARGRPIMPAQPLLSGVLPFFMSPGILVRWIMLTVGLVTAVGFVMSGLILSASGGMGAIAGMCFFAIGCISGFLWLAGAASIIIAIVTESSEGNERVYNWPSTSFLDWLPEFGYLLIAVLVSAFPGWLIGQFAVDDPLAKVAVFAVGIMVCLPIVLLSQLDMTSPWGAVSGRVLASLGRCPISWMLFYAEIALLAAAWGAVAYAAVRFVPGLIFVAVPLFVAGLFLYARLMGRLGWKLAETMAIDEADEND